MASDYKRLPALQRRIADIDPENDIRVRIVGTVIDTADGKIVVDDGTDRAEITTEEQSAKVGNQVRVFCRVLPLENGYELRLELMQDMTDLDLELYKNLY